MSYRQVVITDYGGPEVLAVVEEPALPEPQAGEVRVRVLTASACFTDTLIRRKLYPDVREKPPFALGYDLVGVVDALGEGVTDLQIGQTVADLTVIGAYAEYVCLPAARLTPVPADLNPVTAVSMILTYVTAYQMLHRVAVIEPGQRMLVHGASGAVGTALLELGGLLDLEMFGTASQSKHATVERLGGTPIDYRTEDFVTRIRDLTGDGVDLVIDPIGGDYFPRSFSVLRPGGRLIGYGFQQAATSGRGSVLSIAAGLARFAYWDFWPNGRHADFYSITARRKRHPDQFKEDLQTLFELAAAGALDPVIDRTMPLHEARRAHELIDAGAVTGKIVLTISDTTQQGDEA